jgi:asparagine synthase (glutamine-hydrolysing)
MSGIVGIYRSDGAPVNQAVFERMLKAIARRGPDREGHWTKGPIALGHRLLFTTPESLREQQPVADAGSGCVLVWDGRLDNRDELTRLLEQAGAELRTGTDSALALESYRRWGTECPQRLIGDFAFALWDPRRRSLFAARDRMGLKPFHYAWDGKALLFSSEIAPLLSGLETTPDPDDEMVLALLLREFRDGDHHRTFFQGIRRLPPGHALHLVNGRLSVERYWTIDLSRQTIYQRDEDYPAHFRSLFQEAVRCRLRSYFPVGALVSGGLDSSAIVCAARQLCDRDGETQPEIEAFTLYSDDPGSDERGYFNEAVRAAAVKAHAVHVASGEDPLNGLDDVIRTVESPIIGAGYQDGDDLMETIGARGCRVLLSGEGGDQVLDEVGCLTHHLAGIKPWRFIRETRTMARWYGGVPREFAEMACSMLLPPIIKYWGKRLLRGVPPAWMNAGLAMKVGLRQRVREPRHRMRFNSYCQEDAYLHTCGPYAVLKLEVDECYMASQGTEVRYPFLDSRLVEFVFSIPSARRTREGIWKWILREAMRDILPETIRLRKGKGDWSDSADRALIALCRRNPPAPLENVSGVMERYLDIKGARAAVHRYLGGERNLRQDIWFMLTVDRWLAHHRRKG